MRLSFKEIRLPFLPGNSGGTSAAGAGASFHNDNSPRLRTLFRNAIRLAGRFALTQLRSVALPGRAVAATFFSQSFFVGQRNSTRCDCIRVPPFRSDRSSPAPCLWSSSDTGAVRQCAKLVCGFRKWSRLRSRRPRRSPASFFAGRRVDRATPTTLCAASRASTAIEYGQLWSLRYRAPKRIWADVLTAIKAAHEAERQRQLRALAHETELTASFTAGSEANSVRKARAVLRQAAGEMDALVTRGAMTEPLVCDLQSRPRMWRNGEDSYEIAATVELPEPQVLKIIWADREERRRNERAKFCAAPVLTSEAGGPADTRRDRIMAVPAPSSPAVQRERAATARRRARDAEGPIHVRFANTCAAACPTPGSSPMPPTSLDQHNRVLARRRWERSLAGLIFRSLALVLAALRRGSWRSRRPAGN